MKKYKIKNATLYGVVCNKDESKGTICTIIPDSIPSKNNTFWNKLKQKLYLLRYRIETFWTMCKISLKHRGARKFAKLLYDHNKLTDQLIDYIKEPFNITAEVVDQGCGVYKEFSESIDAIDSSK